ncbi:hypothetical protein [Puniceibacterium sp. IMCC21224]|uniref:hypothetical protein n=1 Tax=Puniceibacterium sp. IMCC21224 TaxID=1618204 RepID=UPI00064D7579|nr:hypothetical protein [Puniceibacterium sp. IMCC21224]KMK65012.1 hypothetical protein IMCC21224_12257 [Puniceibacterium sp. IMCC21224]
MCGEIDEQAAIGGELQDRLRTIAREQGVTPVAAAGSAPEALQTESGRAAYMDAIYRDGLARAFAGIAGADDDQAIDALACQAIALARLAGHLAGHLPPEADLFRATISSLTDGHSDGAQVAAEQASASAHDHHHHDHGHHHEGDPSAHRH